MSDVYFFHLDNQYDERYKEKKVKKEVVDLEKGRIFAAQNERNGGPVKSGVL